MGVSGSCWGMLSVLPLAETTAPAVVSEADSAEAEAASEAVLAVVISVAEDPAEAGKVHL